MQPYLLRAVYDWIVDNDFTPHLMVNAHDKTANVPQAYVDDGKIILNISISAVQDFILNNEYVSFNARFSGKPFPVYVPTSAVLAIFAKENSKGLFFKPEDFESTTPTPPPTPTEPLFKRVK